MACTAAPPPHAVSTNTTAVPGEGPGSVPRADSEADVDPGSEAGMTVVLVA